MESIGQIHLQTLQTQPLFHGDAIPTDEAARSCNQYSGELKTERVEILNIILLTMNAIACKIYLFQAEPSLTAPSFQPTPLSELTDEELDNAQTTMEPDEQDWEDQSQPGGSMPPPSQQVRVFTSYTNP